MPTITIEPAVKIYIGLAAVIVGVLTGCGSQFTTLFGSGESASIMAALSIASAVFGGVTMFLGGASSSTPGPLAKQDPAVVVAATRVANLPSNSTPRDVAEAKNFATAAVANHIP